AGEPARRQRRRGSRNARLNAVHRLGRRRRAERIRRQTRRHDAAARKAVADQQRPATERGAGRTVVIANRFDYSRAASVSDAIAALQRGGGDAKLIAGGHSLLPAMKLRLSEPALLIDIARIPGFAGIRKVGPRIEIGAGTVHHDVATSSLLREACPMLADCAAS